MASKTNTQEKLFDAIAAAVDQVDRLQPSAKAIALSNLALAYRYAAGGTQPGSSVVEK